ncbi:hypothetical protein VSX61_08630 [Brenneria populi subsp. brevivirga]|uniref:hypothetical protein n=1 Tax=Brenneria populi TaxID=1505588 RepID=UPI002E16C5BB|nr:hypothetical protein [Brenneria populi subsp. brevivirga]
MSATNKNDLLVKCTRCRHKHLMSERLEKRNFKNRSFPLYDVVCPRCDGKSYYDLTPQVAWCWASGLIEIGDEPPADGPEGSGAILIATGPKYALKGFLDVVARHGKGASAGKLLVPGVPEAPDADVALEAWLKWCEPMKTAKRDGIKMVLEGAKSCQQP